MKKSKRLLAWIRLQPSERTGVVHVVVDSPVVRRGVLSGSREIGVLSMSYSKVTFLHRRDFFDTVVFFPTSYGYRRLVVVPADDTATLKKSG
ncbi:MAG: hypothetical protein Ct9H300mP15_22300 [Gemmatimonadota bacterium]|nr:MAG: hypothetical protein Ct9H300mP15_22300 [Gemmatimonadota bacterium]